MRCHSLLILVLPTAVACKSEEDDGLIPVFEVTVTSADEAADDEGRCVDDDRNYSETFRYKLIFEGAYLDLLIDDQSFATGTRSGCSISYESAVWLEERPEGDLSWVLTGHAEYCETESGSDWVGTEVFEIVSSEDEDIPVGCTYMMNTEGVQVSGG